MLSDSLCENPLAKVFALQNLAEPRSRCIVDYNDTPVSLFRRVLTANTTSGNYPSAQTVAAALGVSIKDAIRALQDGADLSSAVLLDRNELVWKMFSASHGPDSRRSFHLPIPAKTLEAPAELSETSSPYGGENRALVIPQELAIGPRQNEF